ncbi:uncharacterized protein LOC110012142 [Sesamum indicum]|uniref:Uncharacterized protein LOC110012142 n=1 Tax=Sesamum indicum TaxID=4182 RepID=A0A8M8UUX3_SESIN|nr:uncharacterized protein LOC110012142 [Sesamum indicum]
MNIDRSWMWRRLDDNGFLLDEFVTRVDQEFLNFAFNNPRFLNNGQIKCPCSKCGNTRFLNRSDAHLHIVKNGFTRGYNIWYAHGESVNTRDDVGGSSTAPQVETSRYRTMVMDAIGHEFSSNFTCAEQLPNPEAQKFFNLLKDADEPLWDGCKNHTKLSAVAQLLSIKSEYNLPEACYDRLVSTIKSMLPEDEKLPDNFYTTKKHLGKLGLGYEKIDSCVNNCILYYKENNGLQECPICYHPRYKPIKAGSRKRVAFKVLRYLPLIPRLKRLYASNYTCEHMTWHANNPSSEESMAHPSHGEAWKHFDRTHPSFASDARNDLDIFLRPLIDELKILWTIGVQAYDVCKKQNFNMRAALLWTISDFPANAMVSGWSTHGLLACPYCMERTKSFRLRYGRKACWFDCHRQFLPPDHPYRRQAYKFRKGKCENDSPPMRLTGEDMRQKVDELPETIFGKPPGGTHPIDGFGRTHNWVKRSIFWELPYWHTNLIRHNLDVMHIEKNVFDNIFNTIMDVKDKTKDNVRSRKDLELYCSRTEMHLFEGANGKIYKPKAPYTLTKAQKKELCSWIYIL